MWSILADRPSSPDFPSGPWSPLAVGFLLLTPSMTRLSTGQYSLSCQRCILCTRCPLPCPVVHCTTTLSLLLADDNFVSHFTRLLIGQRIYLLSKVVLSYKLRGGKSSSSIHLSFLRLTSLIILDQPLALATVHCQFQDV